MMLLVLVVILGLLCFAIAEGQTMPQFIKIELLIRSEDYELIESEQKSDIEKFSSELLAIEPTPTKSVAEANLKHRSESSTITNTPIIGLELAPTVKGQSDPSSIKVAPIVGLELAPAVKGQSDPSAIKGAPIVGLELAPAVKSITPQMTSSWGETTSQLVSLAAIGASCAIEGYISQKSILVSSSSLIPPTTSTTPATANGMDAISSLIATALLSATLDSPTQPILMELTTITISVPSSSPTGLRVAESNESNEPTNLTFSQNISSITKAFPNVVIIGAVLLALSMGWAL